MRLGDFRLKDNGFTPALSCAYQTLGIKLASKNTHCTCGRAN